MVTKNGMTTITFISDPSLARRNPRYRNLLLSTVNSHAAKSQHRKRRRTELQRKHLCQTCRTPRSCGGGHGGHEQLALEWAHPYAGVKAKYSEYLRETYCGNINDEQLINNLFSYCRSEIQGVDSRELTVPQMSMWLGLYTSGIWSRQRASVLRLGLIW